MPMTAKKFHQYHIYARACCSLFSIMVWLPVLVDVRPLPR